MKNKNADESLENSRRKFIKKAGKLAIYAPPAMVALMAPGVEAIATSGGVAAFSTSSNCPQGLIKFGCRPPGLDNKP